ncbi:MAG TPA: hypothetical protein PLI51_03255 [bacterium]|nr:hypothetical protein [bacterium]HPQ65736.1 hypothetical protein [bacterium]
MTSLSLPEAIREQFDRILEAIAEPGPAQVDSASVGKDGRHLFDRVFNLLAQGESLPFFRQNYLELSGYAAQLAALAEQLLDLGKVLPESEIRRLADLFGVLRDVTSILGSAWTKLQRSLTEAQREIELVQEPLGKLEKTVTAIALAAPSPAGRLAPAAYGVMTAVWMIDLALKKIIAIRTI